MSDLQIYAFGHALVDEEYSISESQLQALGIAKNHRTLIDHDRCTTLRTTADTQGSLNSRSGGGSAANTIATASILGANCHFSCLLGNDDEGRFYNNQLKEAGIATDENGIRPEGHTGVCLVLLTPDAARTMNTYVGITDFIGPHDINEKALMDADWLYIEGHVLIAESGFLAAMKARDLAKAAGKKIAVNFCDPAVARLCKDRMARLLETPVDLLFCNEEEAAIWAFSEDLDTCINHLKKLAHTWALTLGAEGAVAYDGQTEHRIEAHKVNAVSTLGAGDTFAGAFLYGITQGFSYDQCGHLASAASALLVQQPGPRLTRSQLDSVKQTFQQKT